MRKIPFNSFLKLFGSALVFFLLVVISISQINAQQSAASKNKYVISVFMYQDLNNNGVLDSGEFPLSFATVEVKKGPFTNTVTTDSKGRFIYVSDVSGLYTFSYLPNRFTNPITKSVVIQPDITRVKVNFGVSPVVSTVNLAGSLQGGEVCTIPSDCESNNCVFTNEQDENGNYIARCQAPTVTCSVNNCDITGSRCGVSVNGSGHFCTSDNQYSACCQNGTASGGQCNYSPRPAGTCPDVCRNNTCVSSKKQNGEPCSSRTECQSNSCASNGIGGGVCASLGTCGQSNQTCCFENGTSCLAFNLSCNQNICQASGTSGSTCSSTNPCNSGLACIFNPASQRNECMQGNLPNGSNCQYDQQCQAGLCQSGHCGTTSGGGTGTIGSPCTSNSQCSTGLSCLYNPINQQTVCMEGNLPIGSNCSFDTQCNSQLCQGGLCTDPNGGGNGTCASLTNQSSCLANSSCYWFSNQLCRNKTVNGQFCSQSAECQSGNCSQGGTSSACCPQGQTWNGSQCSTGGGNASTCTSLTNQSQCQANSACAWYTNNTCNVKTANGNFCNNNSECQSGNCSISTQIGVSNICCPQGQTWNGTACTTSGGGGGAGSPVITWTTPTEGRTLSGDVPVQATVTAGSGLLASVKFCVDTVVDANCVPIPNVQNLPSTPVQGTLTTRVLTNGSHKLIIAATNTQNKSSEKSITVTIQNAGGVNPTPTSAGSNPTPVPTNSGGGNQKYACNSNGQCVQDVNGNYTTSNCNNACLQGQKYTCQNNACVPSASGQYSTSNCDNACAAPTAVPTSVNPTSVNPTSVNPTSVNPTSVNPTSVNPTSVNPTSVNPTSTNPTPVPTSTNQKFACNANGQCLQDVNGNFTTSNCNNSCTQGQRYTCSNNACVPSVSGQYSTSTCDNSCVAPTVTPNAPTPTSPPVPTSTPIPTVTPIPSPIAVAVEVKLPGIGNRTGDTATPKRTSREATVIVTDSQNQNPKMFTGNVTYDASTFSFKGNVSVTNTPQGTYILKVKLDNTLAKRAPGTQTLTPGSSITLPSLDLLSGDLDNNNRLDIADFNILRNCYGSKICSQKTQSDLNEDGLVEERDVNIFLRGMAITTTGD